MITDTRPILQATLVELRRMCGVMHSIIRLMPNGETAADTVTMLEGIYGNLTNYNRILDEDVAKNIPGRGE